MTRRGGSRGCCRGRKEGSRRGNQSGSARRRRPSYRHEPPGARSPTFTRGSSWRPLTSGKSRSHKRPQTTHRRSRACRRGRSRWPASRQPDDSCRHCFCHTTPCRRDCGIRSRRANSVRSGSAICRDRSLSRRISELTLRCAGRGTSFRKDRGV